jgi:hypothetical protein
MFRAGEARARTDRDDLGGRTFLPVSEDDPWTGWMATLFDESSPADLPSFFAGREWRRLQFFLFL